MSDDNLKSFGNFSRWGKVALLFLVLQRAVFGEISETLVQNLLGLASSNQRLQLEYELRVSHPENSIFWELYRPTVRDRELLRAFPSFTDRGDPEKWPQEWAALTFSDKATYFLRLVDKLYAVNPDLVWDGERCLVLEKSEIAHSYLALNPSFEAFQELKKNGIVIGEMKTDRRLPADSYAEVTKRFAEIRGGSGVTQVHVLATLPKGELIANYPKLSRFIQLLNDYLFANKNDTYYRLGANRWQQPWFSERFDRFRAAVSSGHEETTHADGSLLPDSNKFVPVAIRYLGEKDGLVTISFELRIDPMKTSNLEERMAIALTLGFAKLLNKHQAPMVQWETVSLSSTAFPELVFKALAGRYPLAEVESRIKILLHDASEASCAAYMAPYFLTPTARTGLATALMNSEPQGTWLPEYSKAYSDWRSVFSKKVERIVEQEAEGFIRGLRSLR